MLTVTNKRYDDLVVVRIWKPEKNGEIGHVSLETNRGDSFGTKPNGQHGIYASFWPESKSFFSTFFNQSPIHNKLSDDKVKYESRNPDIYIIDNLDTDSINYAYKKFKGSNCNWNLLGSSIFKSKKNQNCSGLVYYLLCQGRNCFQGVEIHRPKVTVFDSTIKSAIRYTATLSVFGFFINMTLRTFNSLGTFIMSNCWKENVNLFTAFALIAVVSKVSTTSSVIARKLIIITPMDTIRILESVGAKKVSMNELIEIRNSEQHLNYSI